MRTLCFATNNSNKLREIQGLLGGAVKLVTLEDIGCREDIPEPFETIQENSMAKAQYIWDTYQIAVFADDSGLVVPALDGAPGVHSAYFAGPQRSAQDNMRLLLQRMEGKDPAAYFLTVITLIVDGNPYVFEGRAEGTIVREPRGEEGFGYDPVFVPLGEERTFAQMTMEEKSRLSHRSKAFLQLKDFLPQLT
jgi:XTP/dITP diphosphohydrolase